jgi:hypothetical protein
MSMVEAAKTTQNGVTFVAVSVQDSVLGEPNEADRMIGAMSKHFQCPAVLMGANSHGLWGPPELMEFLARMDPDRLPWKQWDVAA